MPYKLPLAYFATGNWDTPWMYTGIFPKIWLTVYPFNVIFTANSDQIMWLLYALNYETGGMMNLPQSGGALGGCSDITVLPMLKGAANITFLGLGCRMKSAIGPNYLMMGISGDSLDLIDAHILDMSKPIAMLAKQHSGSADK